MPICSRYYFHHQRKNHIHFLILVLKLADVKLPHFFWSCFLRLKCVPSRHFQSNTHRVPSNAKYKLDANVAIDPDVYIDEITIKLSK